jgi:hypothetical protein
MQELFVEHTAFEVDTALDSTLRGILVLVTVVRV